MSIIQADGAITDVLRRFINEPECQENLKALSQKTVTRSVSEIAVALDLKLIELVNNSKDLGFG